MPLTHRGEPPMPSTHPDVNSAEPPAPADGEQAHVAALTLGEEFGGGRLLLSDMRLAFLLTNQARLRTIARLFGIPPDQANLLTLVGAITLATAAQARVQRLLKGPPLPTMGGGLWAGSWARELMFGVAGLPPGETPLPGNLLMIAVVAGAAGPVAIKSLRTIRSSSHRAALDFHHRYGYIVDPGHWRQRRARRAEAAQASATAA